MSPPPTSFSLVQQCLYSRLLCCPEHQRTSLTAPSLCVCFRRPLPLLSMKSFRIVPSLFFFQSFTLPSFFTLCLSNGAMTQGQSTRWRSDHPLGFVQVSDPIAEAVCVCLCVCLQQYQSHQNEKPKNNNKYEQLLGHRRPCFMLLLLFKT